MSQREDVLEILDQQFGDYRAMLTIGMEQRELLQQEDLAGLENSFVRIHELMDHIRIRQSRLPQLDRGDPEIESRRTRLCDLILEIQELRQVNQQKAQQLLERTRREIRQTNKGRQAARGYKNVPRAAKARLFDGTR